MLPFVLAVLKLVQLSTSVKAQFSNTFAVNPYNDNTIFQQHDIPNRVVPFNEVLSPWTGHQVILERDGEGEDPKTVSGAEKNKPGNSNMEKTMNSSETESASLSPLDDIITDLTTPEQIIPIINDLTFIALVILHLPVIIPAILIPLAFYAVGVFLIPIVRVNYFINHKDDGEDGRSLYDGFASYFVN